MNILTFDIEEWFHILDESSTKTENEWLNYESRIHKNVDRILLMLSDNNASATFFCLGWVADKHPDIIKKISDNGYEIGTHSYYHQLAYEQTPEEFKRDLKRSIDVLENATGKKIKSYRAPGFSIKQENNWALEIITEQGIEYDCSIFPAKRGHGGYEDFGSSEPCIIKLPNGSELKEFPVSTKNFLGEKIIFSGGGYFRLFPYSFIKRSFDELDYNMTYFHPRDFDKDQPLIKNLSLMRRFKSYYGLSKAENKLRKLLKEIEFVSLSEANEKINWSKAKKLTL